MKNIINVCLILYCSMNLVHFHLVQEKILPELNSTLMVQEKTLLCLIKQSKEGNIFNLAHDWFVVDCLA